MQLSFYARGDILVPVLGQSRPVGTGVQMASGPPKRYVGREFVPPVNLKRRQGTLTCDEPAKYVCSKAPYTCDSSSETGMFLVRQMTRKRCRQTNEYPCGQLTKLRLISSVSHSLRSRL